MSKKCNVERIMKHDIFHTYNMCVLYEELCSKSLIRQIFDVYEMGIYEVLVDAPGSFPCYCYDGKKIEKVQIDPRGKIHSPFFELIVYYDLESKDLDRIIGQVSDKFADREEKILMAFLKEAAPAKITLSAEDAFRSQGFRVERVLLHPWDAAKLPKVLNKYFWGARIFTSDLMNVGEMVVFPSAKSAGKCSIRNCMTVMPLDQDGSNVIFVTELSYAMSAVGCVFCKV